MPGARSDRRGGASPGGGAALGSLAGESIMPGLSMSMIWSIWSPSRTLSLKWLMKAGPKLRSGPKPIAGSPTNEAPSRSTSDSPGLITVKPSSVGATPVACTDLRQRCVCVSFGSSAAAEGRPRRRLRRIESRTGPAQS